MTDKRGGDVVQANFAKQSNFSNFEFATLFPAGMGGMDDDMGQAAASGSHGHGHRRPRGFTQSLAFGGVEQSLTQSNWGIGGAGGSDNIETHSSLAFNY